MIELAKLGKIALEYKTHELDNGLQVFADLAAGIVPGRAILRPVTGGLRPRATSGGRHAVGPAPRCSHGDAHRRVPDRVGAAIYAVRVTRIVAGTAGGRIIQVPEQGTRPTSDRVREAVFSRLEHLGVVDGARVLDLYAGSGALGLEAASRGAARVTLVESARAAAETCRQNVAALGLPDVTVVAERVERFVQRPVTSKSHLILIDPPYDLSEKDLATVLEALVERLANRGVVVLERSGRTPEPNWPEDWHLTDERHYGDTIVWYAAARTSVAT